MCFSAPKLPAMPRQPTPRMPEPDKRRRNFGFLSTIKTGPMAFAGNDGGLGSVGPRGASMSTSASQRGLSGMMKKALGQ